VSLKYEKSNAILVMNLESILYFLFAKLFDKIPTAERESYDIITFFILWPLFDDHMDTNPIN
jgi:hypothetical protein